MMAVKRHAGVDLFDAQEQAPDHTSETENKKQCDRSSRHPHSLADRADRGETDQAPRNCGSLRRARTTGSPSASVPATDIPETAIVSSPGPP